MLRRVLTIVALLLVGALTARYVGIIRPVEAGPRLVEAANDEARQCVQAAGFRYPEQGIEIQELQRERRRFAAYDRCWSRVASDPRFERLGLVGPAALLHRVRTERFAAWRCVEGRGYRRTTPIPLNSYKGYPLAVTAGHFDVGPSHADLVRFYRAVAGCDDRSLDSLRAPDGQFSRAPAEDSDCVRHTHGGSTHAHGCYWTDDYPGGSG